MTQGEHHELSHDDVQKVMASVDIPACPSVVTDAMKEAQKDEPDIKRLADVISSPLQNSFSPHRPALTDSVRVEADRD